MRDEGEGQIAELRRQVGKLRAEEKELLTLKYAEEVSRELYREEQKRIMAGIQAAEGQIARLQLIDGDYTALYDKACEVIDNFHDLYRRAPEPTRRQ